MVSSMQLETFKVFCDLADTGSFSKAALLNSITQSAVSQQIRALEHRFHVTLIERGRRNFSLTPEGEAFLEASKDILSIYDHLGDRLQELQNVIAGDIKVAAIYSVGLHELPPYLKKYRELHPDVEVHVEYRRSSQIYPLVANNEVDLGLVSYPAKRKGVIIEPFLKDRLVVICHPSHSLASRQRAQLHDIEGEKFIAFEPDLPTRKVIDRHLKEHRVAVRRIMEFDNIETVKRAVEIESGISIVPENTVQQEVMNGSLAAIAIEKPELTRPIGILLKRNRARSPALKEFIALLQSNERQ
jgi:LysR family transcriptional regulator, transcriptional activator of the cysJI operon